MALPASGQISLNDLKTLTGQSALSWVQANTKDAVHDMNSIYGRNYYKRNMDGNCNNGNCAAPGGNCDFQCVNCTLTGINCTNCDAQNWLQADCNCNCSYNCNQNTNVYYNCNCNCPTDCGGGG